MLKIVGWDSASFHSAWILANNGLFIYQNISINKELQKGTILVNKDLSTGKDTRKVKAILSFRPAQK